MLGLSTRTNAENLWDAMSRTFPAYPKGVVPVPEPIHGTAFFPGGLGLCLDGFGEPGSNTSEVMVVGQDFNTFATYENARRTGSEFDSSRTWRNIHKSFPQMGLGAPRLFLHQLSV